MTTVTPITSATQTASSVTATTADSGSSSALPEYDDFLTLLTAQIRSQDPLNPMDSTQFVEQLATFTGVEQQIGTNDRLDQLIAHNTTELSDLASWIGKEVKAIGVGFDFDGTSLEIDMPRDAESTRASVVINDESGRPVATLPGKPEGGTVTWDGTTDSGGQAAAGVYTIDFVYGYGVAGDPDAPEARTTPAEAFGRVTEARLDEDGGTLVLENGEVIRQDAITGVRDPEA